MRHRFFNRPLLAGAILVIANLAALAITPAFADEDQYVPSAANGCGRLGLVSLPRILSTRYYVPYPEDASRRGQKGHVLLRVLVDRYGFARNPEVVISSGYMLLDQASVDSVKDRWRWAPPPPECAESGVITSVVFSWDFVKNPGDSQPDTIYLDSPSYPAQARTKKLRGEGKVEYTISKDNKVADARVTSSTGSPDLDAAMIANVRTRKFLYGIASTTLTFSQRFEFVTENDPVTLKALMGPAIVPDPRYLPGKEPFFTFVEPYPPPGRANGCGRSAPVFLDMTRTNIHPSYPVEGVGPGKQGRTVLDVLVDKGGTAAEVTVAQSSGSPILDQAAIEGVKGLWHWQPPPPECADQGVRLHKNIEWFYGKAALERIMAGDPGYPPEAVAGKLSGRGIVQITRSQDGELEATKVVTSTNSPILDAAMVKFITSARFTPGTKERHTSWTSYTAIDFVGDPDAMLAAAAAPVRRIAPSVPPPSAANDCGRNGDVYLASVDSSHVLVPIPMAVAKKETRLHPEQSFRAQGALKMQVLVDKDGKAASVTVAASSAPPEMERAVTGTVKENYRWNPPPPECAARGVMLDVNYVYTWAPAKLQIYADDPDYPEAAKTKSMGAAGVVQVRYHDIKIDEANVIGSTNSPELDAVMLRLVSDRLLADMRADPKPGFAIQNFALMFMPGFVASPKQLAAQRSQAQAAPSLPAQTAPAP